MGIKAVSVIDGRYSGLTHTLQDIFSEYGLIKQRVYVEIEWLKFLLKDLQLYRAAGDDLEKIDSIFTLFCSDDAKTIKSIERTTNHDVKAVEYFIKEKLERLGLSELKEWVHFACTSDDINNIAYALMLKQGKQLATELLNELTGKIEDKAYEYKSVPMMSRTHGQPATPTTVGKEFINYAWRLCQEIDIISGKEIQAKINGATGNYNAHHFVFPAIDWVEASEKFISRHIGLQPVVFTTQVNPNSSLSYILHAMTRSAAIVIDFDRDMWGYISFDYFKQLLKEGETGSSTMPHKVNPIDFENSEGNMGIAISLMEHLAVKLQKSRFQRDLTDSTVLRSLGATFGYYTIGIKNALKGLGKIDLNRDALVKDLESNPALLAEPFQTAMRIFGENNPYERLKAISRGKEICKKDLDAFVDTLEKVPEDFKQKMKKLTVAHYTGYASKLVDIYFTRKKMQGKRED